MKINNLINSHKNLSHLISYLLHIPNTHFFFFFPYFFPLFFLIFSLLPGFGRMHPNPNGTRESVGLCASLTYAEDNQITAAASFASFLPALCE